MIKQEKLLYFLLLIALMAFVTIGCDGYHYTTFTIAPDTSTSETILSASTNRVSRQVLEAFLSDFGSKNNMWCHQYDPKMKSMFCGISPGINIELHENLKTSQLTLRLAQFGPWYATEEYITLRDSLLREVPEKFPEAFVSGQNK